MVRAVLVLIVIGLSCASLTAVSGAPPDDSSIFGSPDCRVFTGSPTVTSAPNPTPPWQPFYSISLCNDTAGAASDLHVFVVSDVSNPEPLAVNAPGCKAPGYAHSGGVLPLHYRVIDINWGEACVDPGEAVTLDFGTNCYTPAVGCGVPFVNCFYWTLSGQPVVSVSPAVLNPNRCQDAAPVPTPPTPTPTPPFTPTPQGSPGPPTFSPTPTPTVHNTTGTPTQPPGATTTSVVTPASLPHTGAENAQNNWLFASLLVGLALSAVGFVLARRGAIR